MNPVTSDRTLNSLYISTIAKAELMKITVRPATYSDLSAILDIYNEAVLNTTAYYDYQPDTLESRAVWFDAHLQSKLPIFVAELEESSSEVGRIVGWSALSTFRRAHGYRCTAENSIYVAPDRRGQGIGKLLLFPLIESAQRLGLHSIMAGIDADNLASIRLHAAFGFEQVGYLKEVAYKFDRWLDLILMQRLLK